MTPVQTLTSQASSVLLQTYWVQGAKSRTAYHELRRALKSVYFSSWWLLWYFYITDLKCFDLYLDFFVLAMRGLFILDLLLSDLRLIDGLFFSSSVERPNYMIILKRQRDRSQRTLGFLRTLVNVHTFEIVGNLDSLVLNRLYWFMRI